MPYRRKAPLLLLGLKTALAERFLTADGNKQLQQVEISPLDLALEAPTGAVISVGTYRNEFGQAEIGALVHLAKQCDVADLSMLDMLELGGDCEEFLRKQFYSNRILDGVAAAETRTLNFDIAFSAGEDGAPVPAGYQLTLEIRPQWLEK